MRMAPTLCYSLGGAASQGSFPANLEYDIGQSLLNDKCRLVIVCMPVPIPSSQDNTHRTALVEFLQKPGE